MYQSSPTTRMIYSVLLENCKLVEHEYSGEEEDEENNEEVVQQPTKQFKTDVYSILITGTSSTVTENPSFQLDFRCFYESS